MNEAPSTAPDAPPAGPTFAPTRYVMVGLGGIGTHVIRLMTQFLHSQRQNTTIVAIDGDEFESRNRERMQFERLGPKAKVMCEELGPQYGDVVNFLPVPRYLTSRNVGRYIAEGDVVLCQPDNHKTRHLVEKRCAKLDNVALISGGNDGVEKDRTGTYGNVQIYVRTDGIDLSNGLSRFHPEIADPQDLLPTEKGCGATIESAPQLLFTNASVAAAMVSAFYAWWIGRLGYEEVYLETLQAKMVPVSRAVA